MKFLSELVALLMYIDLQKRHSFLKRSMFCQKIIAFSSSAELIKKKSTFLQTFEFFCPKLTVFEPKIDIDKTEDASF